MKKTATPTQTATATTAKTHHFSSCRESWRSESASVAATLQRYVEASALTSDTPSRGDSVATPSRPRLKPERNVPLPLGCADREPDRKYSAREYRSVHSSDQVTGNGTYASSSAGTASS